MYTLNSGAKATLAKVVKVENVIGCLISVINTLIMYLNVSYTILNSEYRGQGMDPLAKPFC